jgi:S-adenosylmethionine:tRNA ribosyltransferase-isomerase
MRPESAVFPYKTSTNQIHIFALFMLVCALMGTDTMQAAYRHAIESGYRFYSYGDTSLLLPAHRRS